ncbi:MAG: phage minor head protein [Eubacterium sp.]
MNKRQKQVEKQLLDNEKAALKALEDNYTVALADVKTRIKELMADELTKSKIYRLEYQRNLERQIKAVLEFGNVKTVNDYLKQCYEDGFIGTLYDISGDGLEMVLPINQDQVVSSVTRPTEGVKLSKRLYNDVAQLQKDVVAEMSRGLSQNLNYRDIAINLANVTEASLKRAYRIARTEGHRVQNEAKLDGMYAARDAGADIVKMWDATMDGKTRPDHVILDGQIRELDEPFTANGHEAMAPGHFGLASEDVHCRCVMLQRARWALGGERLKRDQDARRIISTKSVTYKAWKKDYLQMNLQLFGDDKQTGVIKNAIIDESKESGKIEVHTIGKIDKSIYSVVTPDIRTDEVIITDERIQHIKDGHPNDYERYSMYIKKIIEEPDYILRDNTPNFAVLLKKIEVEDEHFRLIVKLATESDNPAFKNSVITFLKISDKKWGKYLRNKEILYKRE